MIQDPKENLTVLSNIHQNKSRAYTNWFAELHDNEVEKIDGKTVVYLKGLRRLADLAGKVREEVHFGNAFYIPMNNINVPFAQVSYRAEFSDGTAWCGVGDAYYGNCEDLGNYPSSVAESRAEARALRKALGIPNLAKEEIKSGVFEINQTAVEEGINSAQIALILNLAKKKEIPIIDILKKVSSRSVVELKDLTYSEGQEAGRYVNNYKVKKQYKQGDSI